NLVHHDLADLKAYDLERRLPPGDRSPRPERNERFAGDRILVLLKDRDARLLRVEDRAATLADNVDGVAERPDRGGGAAVRTVDGSYRHAWPSLAVWHRYQPSKVRTFPRRNSSKSTALPMYSTGASSL